MKKLLLVIMLLFGFTFVGGTTAHAQNLRQNTPRSYRGTWKLAKSSWSWKGESKTLIVKARYVKHPVFTLGGKRLSVYVGKGFVSFNQLNSHGKRIGENFILRKSHYRGHSAIHVQFDTASQYYIRK